MPMAFVTVSWRANSPPLSWVMVRRALAGRPPSSATMASAVSSASLPRVRRKGEPSSGRIARRTTGERQPCLPFLQRQEDVALAAEVDQNCPRAGGDRPPSARTGCAGGLLSAAGGSGRGSGSRARACRCAAAGRASPCAAQVAGAAPLAAPRGCRHGGRWTLPTPCAPLPPVPSARRSPPARGQVLLRRPFAGKTIHRIVF